MHAAENAVLAKLRAMYARRLTAAQFSEILSCRTMGEVALYLRDKTPYGGIVPVTAGLGDVHREWLEERLRQASYSRFEAVGHYAFAIDAPFYRYFVLEHEAERLIRTLSLSVRGGGALPEASAFFLRHSVVDWLRVGQAKTPQQWLSALSGTPYHALCAPFIGPDGVDMVLLDRSLERHKMRALLQLADTCYGGAQHDALRQQLMIRIDMSDIAALYRAVLLGQRTGGAATGGGLLTERQLSQLSAAPDEVRGQARSRARRLDRADGRPVSFPFGAAHAAPHAVSVGRAAQLCDVAPHGIARSDPQHRGRALRRIGHGRRHPCRRRDLR